MQRNPKIKLKYVGEDRGNARYYFDSEQRGIYCLQLVTGNRYEFLVCSKDGEPSHGAIWSRFECNNMPEGFSGEIIEED